MNKKRSNQLLLFIIFFTVVFGLGNFCLAEDTIIINEILIGGESSDEEFVELFNPTSSDINLEALPLKMHTISSTGADTNKTLHFTQNTIKSNGYFLISSSKYQEKYKDTITTDATYSASLVSNGAVYISKSSSKDTAVIDLVCWGSSTKCATPLTNITKYSLEKISDSEWQESYVLGGTPGEKNSEKPAPLPPKIYSDKIYLNELLPDPKESPEKNYEFVELYNAGSEDVDLSGWKIKDKTGDFDLSGTIAKEGYAIFYNTVTLNNSGDEIKLLNPDGKEVDEIIYSGGKEDFSYSFDGNVWKWTSLLTPGKENEFLDFSKDIKIIAFAPNPAGSDTKKEWLEIKNGTKKEIDLKGWSIATGWKKLYNHPIRESFKIKPGKSKKLTRKICAFTLNNTKDKIELRNPLGETVQEIKYNRKKEKILDDEVYLIKGKKWKWDKSASPVPAETATAAETTAPASSPTVILAPIISEEELKLKEEEKEIERNIDKFTPEPEEDEEENNNEEFSKIKAPNNLALDKSISKFSKPEGRVLGASDIRQTDSQYLFTPAIEQKHWARNLGDSLWQEINSTMNGLLLKF